MIEGLGTIKLKRIIPPTLVTFLLLLQTTWIDQPIWRGLFQLMTSDVSPELLGRIALGLW